jgi:hypothetical protein
MRHSRNRTRTFQRLYREWDVLQLRSIEETKEKPRFPPGLFYRRRFSIHLREPSFEGDPKTSRARRSSSALSCIRDRSWRTRSTASASEAEAVTCPHNSRMRSSKVIKHERRSRTKTTMSRYPTLTHYSRIPMTAPVYALRSEVLRQKPDGNCAEIGGESPSTI